jgi:hypothetical protein
MYTDAKLSCKVVMEVGVMAKKHKLDGILDGLESRRPRNSKRLRGAAINSSKLTEEDVLGIRMGYKLGFSCDELAKYYTAYLTHRHGKPTGVTRQSVWRIVRRVDWKHVPDPEPTPEIREAVGAELQELGEKTLVRV